MVVGQTAAIILSQFLAFAFTAVARGDDQAPTHVLLDHLRGDWVMTGSVMKKPVQYEASGTWILKNQFLSFHMKDAAVPSTYEANLLMGVDTSKNQYVVHWLDSFGGAGSRVVGFGPLSQERIEIIYPYAEGKFRNLFEYDSKKDAWTLVIESEGKEKNWAPFANYTISRKQ